MDVSEKTKEEQGQTQQADQKSIVPAVVRNSTSSGTRVLARDTSSGRFARSRKKLDEDLKTTERIERDLRTLVTRPATDAEGKPIVDKDGKPVPTHIAVAEHLLKMMLELKDEKAIGAAGKTLESILTRAIGKPSDSAVTRDALQHSGVRVAVLQVPEGLPESKEEKRKPLPAPAFAKAEVVSENPAQNSDQITED